MLKGVENLVHTCGKQEQPHQAQPNSDTRTPEVVFILVLLSGGGVILKGDLLKNFLGQKVCQPPSRQHPSVCHCFLSEDTTMTRKWQNQALSEDCYCANTEPAHLKYNCGCSLAAHMIGPVKHEKAALKFQNRLSFVLFLWHVRTCQTCDLSTMF